MKISLGLDSLKSTSASSTSDNSFEASTFPEYEDLKFVRKLSEAKFPVYLVTDNTTDRQYAMKVFPWEDNAPSVFFLREVRFTQFAHSNIIPFINHESEQKHTSGSESVKFSYILMEYAPYGDFFDVLITSQVPFSETLVRTYCHQLVKGIEAIHAKGAAHLDLKLENFLMNKEFTLKITDFDLGYLRGDGKVKTKGTKNFRAPEILNGTCFHPQAADVFSMGIVLFILKTGGMIPYNEDESPSCLDFEEFQKIEPKAFWEKQCSFLNKSPSFFTEDFKSLFIWMTKAKPEERPTLSQIKRSRWFVKEILSEEELIMFMEDKLKI